MLKYMFDRFKNMEDFNTKFKSYFSVYTIVFCICCLFCFSWYILTGRTFIGDGDGWTQHYRALIYYSKWLRSIVSNIIYNHQLNIPLWDFSLGEGSDVLHTLHYYVIGDPFTVFSVFIPERFMYLYYDAMMLLRLYISGIAFSFLSFQTQKKNGYAVLAGAMSYVFCSWTIFNVVRHPYFLNPMIYFPILIIGIERILKGKRTYLFTIAVFLSAVSNFYFFYVLVMVTIIYVVIRVFTLYSKNVKQALLMLLRIVSSSILGVLLASFILLPICYSVLHDARLSAGNEFHLLYPLSYYSQLPSLFITPYIPYWMCMGFSAPVLIAVFLLFYKRKENQMLKFFFIICLIICCIPVLGQILNGFSYMSNKWCWAFALLSAYILTTMWPSLMKLSMKEGITLFSMTTIYCIVCFVLEYSRKIESFIALLFALVFLFLTLNVGGYFSQGKKQLFAFLIVLIGIFNNAFWKYSSDDAASGTLTKEIRQVSEELYADDASAIAYVSADTDSFYRYSGRQLTKNAAMLQGISSTRYYWSLSNPHVYQFRSSTEQAENSPFDYAGYDDRTALISLASVLYYAIPNGDLLPLPYGFSYIDTINVKASAAEEAINKLKNELMTENLTEDQLKIIRNSRRAEYKVYQNDFALPLSYTYNNTISTEDWELLSSVEKQETLLQAAVLDDFGTNSAKGALCLTSQNINYTLSCNGNNISILNNAFVVTSPNATITLEFEGLSNSETYCSINGLFFEGVPTYDLYFGREDVDPLNIYNKTNWDLLSHIAKKNIRKEKLFWTAPTSAQLTLKASSGTSKALAYHTNDYSWYSDRHNFTINLGYTEEAPTSVTITFSNIGIYTFDSIDITCQPMDNYIDMINALKQDTLINTAITTNKVSGTISLNESKLLCLSIPYSVGWKAYVDGNEADLYPTNIMYMGLNLDAGEHTIELIYKTPLLQEGIYISVIAAGVFVCLLLLSRYRARTY